MKAVIILFLTFINASIIPTPPNNQLAFSLKLPHIQQLQPKTFRFNRNFLCKRGNGCKQFANLNLHDNQKYSESMVKLLTADDFLEYKNSISGQQFQKFLDLYKDYSLKNPFDVEEFKSYNNFLHELGDARTAFLETLQSQKIKLLVEADSKNNIFQSKIYLKKITIANVEYEIQKYLGKGLSGVAYLCLKSEFGIAEPIVVKFPIVPHNVYDLNLFKNDFEMELRALKITGLESGSDELALISVQTFIEGKSVEGKIKQLLTKNPQELEILKKKFLESGDEFYEKYKIIHSDMAPRNAIIGLDGKIHLIDFGQAKIVERVNDQYFLTEAEADIISRRPTSVDEIQKLLKLQKSNADEEWEIFVSEKN